MYILYIHKSISCKVQSTSQRRFLLLHIFKNVYYWSIIDLQFCVNFSCTAKWVSESYIYIHIIFRFHSCLWHHLISTSALDTVHYTAPDSINKTCLDGKPISNATLCRYLSNTLLQHTLLVLDVWPLCTTGNISAPGVSFGCSRTDRTVLGRSWCWHREHVLWPCTTY